MYTAAAFWSNGRGLDSINALSVIEFIVGIPPQGFECLNKLVKRLFIGVGSGGHDFSFLKCSRISTNLSSVTLS
jgi:hypothetical protein